ncbi:MAG: hypothetical protein ACREAA_19340 [Candidatus Polarisedimenticolia bacterium]
MRRAVALGAWIAGAALAPLHAQVTDPEPRIPIARVSRPPLRETVTLPEFEVSIRRVTGDNKDKLCLPGRPCPDPRANWGTHSTHHGFKDQPWNADESLLWLRNTGANAWPTGLMLDAITYAPAGVCPEYSSVLQGGDDRWHPDPARKNVRVAVSGRAPKRLVWYDVVACRLLEEAWIPAESGFTASGIGDGEGNLSADGRYTFLHDRERLLGRLVDMRPTRPCPVGAPPSGGMCFGPVIPLACGVAGVTCSIGHSGITPSGARVVVKYAVKGKEGGKDDMLRVYDTDLARLTLTPRRFPMDPPCRATSDIPTEPGREGFIFRLAHEDLASNPFEGGREYAIGARRKACGDDPMNRVVMVDLETGAATPISMGDPRTEAAPHHVSARASRRPGWVYVTYRSDSRCVSLSACRFSDEVVALRMSGGSGRACERYGHVRSDLDVAKGDDDDEGHAVPSLDGRHILFRSTWSRADACSPPLSCSPTGQINAYVMEKVIADKATAPPSAPAGGKPGGDVRRDLLRAPVPRVDAEDGRPVPR